MASFKLFQCVIVVSLIVLFGVFTSNAQIWFGGSESNQTNDSSSSQPVKEAHRTSSGN